MLSQEIKDIHLIE